mmetsp:Transcript_67644/g.162398  ORF Transcript_67644/g.162398 Transcript_67644/m.162398 type:complete len:147 (+) Transcript_67644:252-692(+)
MFPSSFRKSHVQTEESPNADLWLTPSQALPSTSVRVPHILIPQNADVDERPILGCIDPPGAVLTSRKCIWGLGTWPPYPEFRICHCAMDMLAVICPPFFRLRHSRCISLAPFACRRSSSSCSLSRSLLLTSIRLRARVTASFTLKM